MFYHSKELQFKARVSRPDPRFARLLLEQFGGGNGELSAAMQYFVQAFACRKPYPDKYDMLMDIATEELGHLEIVGATVQMLLSGVNGNLKDAVDRSPVFGEGKRANDLMDDLFSVNPQFGVLTGGGPRLTDSNGSPWQGCYVNAVGDLTIDLRSNIAAESRAKIVYEYLMQFTDDKYVLATLDFLMAREIAHFQQFEAALDTIRPNFPPGVLQGNPRYCNLYSNHSQGEDALREPWNSGESTGLGEEWQYVEDPRRYAVETDGLTAAEPRGTDRTDASVRAADRKLSELRSDEIRRATPSGEIEWCSCGRKASVRKPVREAVKQK